MMPKLTSQTSLAVITHHHHHHSCRKTEADNYYIIPSRKDAKDTPASEMYVKYYSNKGQKSRQEKLKL